MFDQEKTQGPPGRDVLSLEKEREWKRRGADAPMQTEQPAGNTCGPLMPDEFIVAEFFRYHAPSADTIPKYESINQAAKNFAAVILANCPRGADRSHAIRLLRECRMTANAAIALNGLSL